MTQQPGLTGCQQSLAGHQVHLAVLGGAEATLDLGADWLWHGLAHAAPAMAQISMQLLVESCWRLTLCRCDQLCGV